MSLTPKPCKDLLHTFAPDTGGTPFPSEPFLRSLFLAFIYRCFIASVTSSGLPLCSFLFATIQSIDDYDDNDCDDHLRTCRRRSPLTLQIHHFHLNLFSFIVFLRSSIGFSRPPSLHRACLAALSCSPPSNRVSKRFQQKLSLFSLEPNTRCVGFSLCKENTTNHHPSSRPPSGRKRRNAKQRRPSSARPRGGSAAERKLLG